MTAITIFAARPRRLPTNACQGDAAACTANSNIHRFAKNRLRGQISASSRLNRRDSDSS